MEAKDRIIVALDLNHLTLIEHIIADLAPHVGMFKVGLKAISGGYAVDAIQKIQAFGGKIFYDAKFFDTPKTVAEASSEVTGHGVTMFSVHCLSGHEAMRRAVKAAWASDRATNDRPLVLGVTLLTSLNHAMLVQLGIFQSHENDQDPVSHLAGDQADMERLVVTLARAAQACGLNGVTASPLEIQVVREACGPDFLIVSPGIRPAGSDLNDQKRVMTPGKAIKAGADYLVIGRPITQPKSGTPVEAAKRISEEIASAI